MQTSSHVDTWLTQGDSFCLGWMYICLGRQKVTADLTTSLCSVLKLAFHFSHTQFNSPAEFPACSCSFIFCQPFSPVNLCFPVIGASWVLVCLVNSMFYFQSQLQSLSVRQPFINSGLSWILEDGQEPGVVVW
jgi:hypothetical protein